jgi:arylsulfatase A-like enzyme
MKHFTILGPGLAGRSLGVAVLAWILSLAWTGAEPARTSPALQLERGEQFLTNLFEPALELLPEYAGAKVYWLYHDNYLAAKLLDSRRPDLAQRIRSAIRRYGIERSGKIEILFGEAPEPLPFRHYVLTNVAQADGRTIRTEQVAGAPWAGWEAYADLLFMAALAEAPAQPDAARAHFSRALALWDGRGFEDQAVRGTYATYKLALAVITGARLHAELPMREAVLDRLAALQSPSGGWITDYDAAGQPRGLANVETTCTVMLALRTLDAPAPAAPRKPNIIFFLADDLGYGDLGCFGQRKMRTPNLDRLAAEGLRFTQHYAGNAVCAPSRCVFMTGKHPGHAWVRDNRELKPEGQTPLPAGTVTLARLLQQQGYATAAMGKWGLGGPGSEGDPLKQGFDRFYGYNCQRVAHNYYPAYLWDNDRRVTLDNPEFSFYQKLPPEAAPEDPASYRAYRGKEYAPDLIREQALRFVREHQSQPFFLYYATTVPHLALQVPEDSLKEYLGQWPDPPYPGTNNYLPHYAPRAAYAAMVTRLDRDIGQIVGLIKELGLDDRTLVVFTSDNGPLYNQLGGTDTEFFASAGPLRGRKGALLEGGFRVPMLIRWPGHIAAGGASDRVTGFEDWLPTFLDLVGAGNAKPPGLDGLSFAPTLAGQAQPPRPFLYREFPAYGGWQIARQGDWKAVRQNLNRPPGRNPAPAAAPILTELYNLKDDIAEARDVAAEHPEIVEQLEQIMRAQHEPSALFPIRALDGQTPAQTR